MFNIVKTKGIPDSRGYSSIKIPSSISLYSENKKVSEQEFASKHPLQHKSLQVYLYTSKTKNHKPLKKFKKVIAINKPFIHDSVDAARVLEQNSKDSDLILPLNSEKSNKFYPFVQSQAIAHEEAHTFEKPSKNIKIETQILKQQNVTKKDLSKIRTFETELASEQVDQQYMDYIDTLITKPKHRKIYEQISGVKINPKLAMVRREPSKELKDERKKARQGKSTILKFTNIKH